MAYVEGFVAAVPAANRDAYRQHVLLAAPLFQEFGVTRMVENWGDDVPDGKLTDFKGAVQAGPDEVVVFSWCEYPSREVRDAATVKIMNDPRMQAVGAGMPFDARRLIYGGFTPRVDDSAAGETHYVDGYLVPVPAGNRDAYFALAAKASVVFREYGAVRVVEAWEDDVPDGKLTDYRRAVKIEGDEKVVFSWVEWPSKDIRNEAWKKVMADPRMQPGPDSMPFDGKRLIYGGFVPVLDTAPG